MLVRMLVRAALLTILPTGHQNWLFTDTLTTMIAIEAFVLLKPCILAMLLTLLRERLAMTRQCPMLYAMYQFHNTGATYR